jgi:pSer/pThr/pTyr-binding forkhead associated (FHA) protein
VTAVLVVIDGELEGEVYRLRKGENKLGRAQTCDVVLPSVKISREHATVICEEGLFAIAPLSEKNPTTVNDVVTEGSELSDGDLVCMGKSTFRFRTIEGL